MGGLHIWQLDDDVWRHEYQRSGHTKIIRSIVFSPDGQHFASSSDDFNIIYWSLTERRKLLTWEGHRGRCVRALAFMPSGLLISAGFDSMIRVWNVSRSNSRPQETACFPGHKGGLLGVTCSNNGQISSLGRGGRLIQWDPTQTTVIHHPPHHRSPHDLQPTLSQA